MSKEKVKNFCKKYGKEILIGAGGIIVGGTVVGFVAKKNSSLSKSLGDVLTSFGSNKKEKIEIVNKIVTAQTNSTHMDVHVFGETYGSTLGNIGELLDEWYKKNRRRSKHSCNGVNLI